MSAQYTLQNLVLVVLVVSGCAHKAPTIAHLHVGHALTGWFNTPEKAGFFVVAENQAEKALDAAQITTARVDDIEALPNLYSACRRGHKP
jgi:hypothetical protein